MSTRIPPLHALRGFEAAARHGSFSRAADELEITQSAVSHHVRLVEDHVGQLLFRRENRSVVLTDAGYDFMLTIRGCLHDLGAGIRRLDQYKKPNQLIVNVNHAFASKWLLPRLSSFRRLNPKIDVWLYTNEREVDLDYEEVDVRIAYGNVGQAGYWSRELFNDVLVPVCAPALARTLPQSPKPTDLLELTMLHDERQESWGTWFECVGVAALNPVIGPNFSDSGLLIDAAVHGQGVALASVILAAEELKAGRLVCPLPLTLGVEAGYVIVCKPDDSEDSMNKRFFDWLGLEADRFVETHDIGRQFLVGLRNGAP